MNTKLRYYFEYVDNCNMCGAETSNHKVLGKRLNKKQGKSPWKKVGITTTIAKCTSCGLIYSNPQPIPFDIQDHYGLPPEDYWKRPGYLTIEQNYREGEIATCKRLMDFKPGMKALDIGSGLGKAMIAFDNAGFDTYGFEPSKPFYERALSQMKINPDKLKFATIEDVEYPENFFDFIAFGAVLEHIYDPSAALKKAMTWAKPGGIIQIEVPSSKWLIPQITHLYYKVIGTDYVSNLCPMHRPFHLHEFSFRSFQEHARQNDYDIVHHEYYVCRTYMPKVFDYVLVPYMKWTNKGMQLAIWLKKK